MFKRFLSLLLLFCFLVNTIGPRPAHAQGAADLPVPGTMVSLSPAYAPVLMKGLRVHPENPFKFDFIMDTGHSKLDANDPVLKTESNRLIKYFLTALTVPEKDLWVNLSPYEKDRLTSQNLGQTQMGQDLLAQDYILKQLTASLIYPEKDLGKAFWDKVYAKAQQLYGTTQVPVNTFNKVWIVAERADIFERNNTAYVTGAHLKVMLEEDYMAKGKHDQTQAASLSSQIVKEIILPEIEREVNEGKSFAPLRQMFYSMILASWYKMALKDALINQLYSNQGKTAGVKANDPQEKEKIFERYLEAYKKGVFNYIKDQDPTSAGSGVTSIPRKYFSGGADMANLATSAIHRNAAMFAGALPTNAVVVSGGASPAMIKDVSLKRDQWRVQTLQGMFDLIQATIESKASPGQADKWKSKLVERVGALREYLSEANISIFQSSEVVQEFLRQGILQSKEADQLASFDWQYWQGRILKELGYQLPLDKSSAMIAPFLSGLRAGSRAMVTTLTPEEGGMDINVDGRVEFSLKEHRFEVSGSRQEGYSILPGQLWGTHLVIFEQEGDHDQMVFYFHDKSSFLISNTRSFPMTVSYNTTLAPATNTTIEIEAGEEYDIEDLNDGDIEIVFNNERLVLEKKGGQIFLKESYKIQAGTVIGLGIGQEDGEANFSLGSSVERPLRVEYYVKVPSEQYPAITARVLELQQVPFEILDLSDKLNVVDEMVLKIAMAVGWGALAWWALSHDWAMTSRVPDVTTLKQLNAVESNLVGRKYSIDELRDVIVVLDAYARSLLIPQDLEKINKAKALKKKAQDQLRVMLRLINLRNPAMLSPLEFGLPNSMKLNPYAVYMREGFFKLNLKGLTTVKAVVYQGNKRVVVTVGQVLGMKGQKEIFLNGNSVGLFSETAQLWITVNEIFLNGIDNKSSMQFFDFRQEKIQSSIWTPVYEGKLGDTPKLRTALLAYSAALEKRDFITARKAAAQYITVALQHERLSLEQVKDALSKASDFIKLSPNEKESEIRINTLLYQALESEYPVGRNYFKTPGVRNYVVKFYGAGGEVSSTEALIAMLGGDSESHFDYNTLVQRIIFKSDMDWQFSDGILYHGMSNLDKVLEGGVFEEMHLTRVGQNYGTGYLGEEGHNPAIILIDARNFNKLRDQGKASVRMVGGRLGRVGDPYPEIKAGLAFNEVVKVLVSEDTWEEYQALIKQSPNSKKAQRIKYLIKENKLEPLKGLRHRGGKEESYRSAARGALLGYMVHHDLLKELPFLEVRPNQASNQEDGDIIKDKDGNQYVFSKVQLKGASELVVRNTRIITKDNTRYAFAWFDSESAYLKEVQVGDRIIELDTQGKIKRMSQKGVGANIYEYNQEGIPLRIRDEQTGKVEVMLDGQGKLIFSSQARLSDKAMSAPVEALLPLLRAAVEAWGEKLGQKELGKVMLFIAAVAADDSSILKKSTDLAYQKKLIDNKEIYFVRFIQRLKEEKDAVDIFFNDLLPPLNKEYERVRRALSSLVGAGNLLAGAFPGGAVEILPLHHVQTPIQAIQLRNASRIELRGSYEMPLKRFKETMAEVFTVGLKAFKGGKIDIQELLHKTVLMRYMQLANAEAGAFDHGVSPFDMRPGVIMRMMNVFNDAIKEGKREPGDYYFLGKETLTILEGMLNKSKAGEIKFGDLVRKLRLRFKQGIDQKDLRLACAATVQMMQAYSDLTVKIKYSAAMTAQYNELKVFEARLPDDVPNFSFTDLPRVGRIVDAMDGVLEEPLEYGARDGIITIDSIKDLHIRIEYSKEREAVQVAFSFSNGGGEYIQPLLTALQGAIPELGKSSFDRIETPETLAFIREKYKSDWKQADALVFDEDSVISFGRSNPFAFLIYFDTFFLRRIKDKLAQGMMLTQVLLSQDLVALVEAEKAKKPDGLEIDFGDLVRTIDLLLSEVPDKAAFLNAVTVVAEELYQLSVSQKEGMKVKQVIDQVENEMPNIGLTLERRQVLRIINRVLNVMDQTRGFNFKGVRTHSGTMIGEFFTDAAMATWAQNSLVSSVEGVVVRDFEKKGRAWKMVVNAKGRWNVRVDKDGQQEFSISVDTMLPQAEPLAGLADEVVTALKQLTIVTSVDVSRVIKDQVSRKRVPGGIDLDKNKMQMRVSRQVGQAAAPALTIDPAMIERLKRDGIDSLEFHIETITPLTNLPQFLSLREDELKEQLAGV